MRCKKSLLVIISVDKHFLVFLPCKLNWFYTGQSWLTSWGYRTDPPVDNAELLQWGNEAADAIKSLYGTKYDVGSAGSTLYLAGKNYKTFVL